MSKKVDKRKEEIEVYVSPSWKLQREGNQVKFIAAACFPYEKTGLVKVKISAEEDCLYRRQIIKRELIKR